jgi:hypothetical protein
MLKPVHEPYNGPVSYGLSAALVALATEAARNTGATDLNQPYGAGDTIGFVSGQIVKIGSENSETVISLPAAGSDDPFGILADGFTDSLKTNKASIYPLSFGGQFKVKGCYDTAQTYAVGTLLTFIPSGTNAGKLTPASLYGSQKIVARVTEAPASAADDDEMVIEILYQVEV